MEEIVIKTEVIKVKEMDGRDKQIYDYAYKKGVSDEKTRHNSYWIDTSTLSLFCGVIGFTIGKIFNL